MLKTKSIWIPAFMHAVFDQTANYVGTVVNRPANPVFSFGIGLYGLAMLAVIVLLLLRDPVWRDERVSFDGTPPQGLEGV